jgi:3-methyladenine DNA glycosylase AlkD
MHTFEDISTALVKKSDPPKALKMKAYMRDQFEFLGVHSPERKELFSKFFKELIPGDHPKPYFVENCYKRPDREFHYLAMEYVFAFRKNLSESDIGLIRSMLVTHAWWDTVDFIASKIVGYIVKRYPSLKDDVLTAWIDDDKIWLRRTSIIFQLSYKAETDTEFLKLAILQNLSSSEFFINKAIGWALRQYSKTDPEWVRSFIQKHELQPLSLKEASKYI